MAKPAIAADAMASLAIAFVLTLLGTLVGDATLAMLIVPLVFLLAAYAMTRMPLRVSVMGLAFLVFVLENPNDASPIEDYEAPFTVAGELLLIHVNAAARSHGVNVSWAAFSLMDLFIVWLLGVGWVRSSARSRLDGSLPTPRPLVKLALLSLGGTGLTWMWGLATGGDFGMSLWQVNAVLFLPLILLICHHGLRGPEDLEAMAKVVLVAAVYKALTAAYIALVVSEELPGIATGHQDSILFANAFVIVLAMMLERVGGLRRASRLALLLLPVLGLGMWANNRRLVWVQVAAVFLTVYLMAPSQNRVKKRIQRTLYVLSPFIAAYIAMGWNAEGGVFAPVQTLRSVVEPETDGSSLWRELENYNLVQTIKTTPLLGTGYGHGFIEFIALPEVTYPLERFLPHNSVLGIWAYCGLVGFTTLTLLWVAGVYFAVRTYHAAREPRVRAGALAILGAVTIYLLQSWGDLGIGSWKGVFTVGPALAMAGKLAVATGAWRPQGAAARKAAAPRGAAAR